MTSAPTLAALDALEFSLDSLERTPPLVPGTALAVIVLLVWLGLFFLLPGFWGLVLKQMRQRLLGTSLTLLSVGLGSALAVGIFVLKRGSESLFLQREFGYQLIVGSSKGSPLQLTLNTVYGMDQSPGNFQYEVYERLAAPMPPPPPTAAELQAMSPDDRREARAQAELNRKRFPYNRYVKLAVPFARGDTYRGRPILATSTEMFGQKYVEDAANPAGRLDPIPVMESVVDAEGKVTGQQVSAGVFQYRPGERFEVQEGRVFHARKFEAVIGSEVARRLGLKVNDTFRASHGDSTEEEPKKTGTAKPHPAHEVPPSTGPATAPHDDDHDHGVPATRPATLPATGPAAAHHDDDHDHDHDAPATRPTTAPATKTTTAPAGHDHAGHSHAGHSHAGHDDEAHGEHEHAEKWTVVGILKPTGTVFDRTLFIPIVTFYCIDDHDQAVNDAAAAQAGLKAAARTAHHEEPYELDANNLIVLKTPKSKWQLSGVFVQTRGRDPFLADRLQKQIKDGGMGAEVLAADVIAVNPVTEMRKFFDVFLKPSSQVLLLISVLVSVLAVVGILVSIYNSVAARTREIAILRALGATKWRVLLLICLEAGTIGLVGAILGWAAGHVIGAAASQELESRFGQGFNWAAVGTVEIVFLAAVTAVALFAGLVPALKAYRTPVATNLVAG